MQIKSAEFKISAASSKQYPDGDFPEVVLVGKSNVGNAGMLSKRPITPPAMNTCAVPNGLTTRAVRGAAHSARMSLNSSSSPLWEKSSGSSSCCGAARKRPTRCLPVRVIPPSTSPSAKRRNLPICWK